MNNLNENNLNENELIVLDAVIDGHANAGGCFTYFDEVCEEIRKRAVKLTQSQIKGYISQLTSKGYIICGDDEFEQINLTKKAAQVRPGLIDTHELYDSSQWTPANSKPENNPFLETQETPENGLRVWTKHGLGLITNARSSPIAVLHANGLNAHVPIHEMWIEKPIKYEVVAVWPGCRFNIGDTLETYPNIKSDYAYGPADMPPINSVQAKINETIGRAWVVDPHKFPANLMRIS